MLSIYVLTKSGFEFSKLTKRLILEHHEMADGTGFPRSKKEDKISTLSYYVSLADQLIMFSEGLITGNTYHLFEVLDILVKQVDIQGLRTGYPKFILDSLLGIKLNEEERKRLESEIGQ